MTDANSEKELGEGVAVCRCMFVLEGLANEWVVVRATGVGSLGMMVSFFVDWR